MRLIGLFFVLAWANMSRASDDGMCTEPPKVEGGDCGGDSSHSESIHESGPFMIDITATVSPDLPYW